MDALGCSETAGGLPIMQVSPTAIDPAVDGHLIHSGDTVALVRADWCKIGIVKAKSTIRAGKDTIPLEQLIGKSYGVLLEWKRATRQLCFVADTFDNENDGDFTDISRTNSELHAETAMQCDDVDELETDDIDADDIVETTSITSTATAQPLSQLINSDSAPLDNRLVMDDSLHAQRLTSMEILDLRKQGSSGADMVRHLISNSATFQIKPVLTRDKYVRKKLSKHTLRFRVVRPSLRTIIKSYGATPMKISALRLDTISYMLHRANVFPGGTHVVCDGVQGVLLGAVVHRVQGNGMVIRITNHKGEECGRAFGFFGFGEISRNALSRVTFDELRNKPRVAQNGDANLTVESAGNDTISSVSSTPDALKVLQTLCTDSLLIALRPEFHPANLFRHLFKCLGLSRPFVVYCPYHEPLAELFSWLKNGGRAVRLQLEEFEMIDYQVLPERTHPENMTDNGGSFILSGIKVEEKSA